MQTAFVTAPLASTPPQHTPTRGARRTTGGVLAFRTSSEEVSGSVSRGPSSVIESGSWRSLASSSTKNSQSPHLTSTKSIPKSTTFVKVEGFQTASSSVDSLPSSPHSPNFRTASSLLSRQLSEDNLNTLHRPIPTSSHGHAAALAQRLETQCNNNTNASSSTTIPLIEPKARPASLPRRPSVPDNLLPQLQSRHPVFTEPLVIRAFHISRLAHDGRYDGPNGEPAFSRCIGAATILAELGADEVAVAGSLLHDALDKTMLLEGQLKPMLANEETLDLVKKVSHLGYICHKHRTATNTASDDPGKGVASHLVSLLVAHGPPRALLVRLAVALQDARALDAAQSPPHPSTTASTTTTTGNRHRHAAAIEAIDVWAPLANRLGVWSLKAELEDRAFRSLRPAEYAELRDRLERVQEPTQLVALVDTLRASLHEAGVEYIDLSGRPKHLWGVWKKMQAKGYSADRVQDVRGLRVIVRSREDCYKALRAVETAWKIASPAKNYIKDPKANGYQSLHAVADPGDGHRVEIQIRTDKMHYLAEYGAEASHWKYKEGSKTGRGIGGGAASTTAMSSMSDPPAGKSGVGGITQEANWAKFVTSQHVAHDKKYRPSGSPSEDQSLSSILATISKGNPDTIAAVTVNNTTSAAAAAIVPPPTPMASSTAGTPSTTTDAIATAVIASPSASTSSPSPSPKNGGRSFHEYIAASGQNPTAPPPQEEQRVLVAVIAGGTFSVAQLEPRTTIGQLLASSCGTDIQPKSLHVIVNRQEETELSAVLMPGDVVELYAETASVSPVAPPPGSRMSSKKAALNPLITSSSSNLGEKSPPPPGKGALSNLMPLGGLSKKLASVSLAH